MRGRRAGKEVLRALRKASLRMIAPAVGVALWCFLVVVGAAAQISPGELSRAHAGLEGSARCLECHASRTGVDRTRCLSCHEPIAERIEAGLGLHAQPGYERCETCHIEHHGLEFELVWWGEAGVSSFDHALTGYPLEGAHRRVERESGCRGCHRPELIADRRPLVAAGKDLRRTYLGLDTACLSCHEDEHRGQVAADSCLTCHDLSAWLPAPGFDHAETRFPLSGRHEEVECKSCHGTVESSAHTAEPDSLEFRIDRFASCSDCHRDPHQGRLGAACSECHTTEGWLGFDRASFDHGRTRFPLRGAHRPLGCTECHAPGRGFEVARFSRCVDCHVDPHVGQLDTAAGDAGCVGCHSVDGFLPADFPLAAHQASDYPLEGAHLAVACVSCHREISTAELNLHWDVARGALPSRTRQFRFRGTACADCHDDPHEGELDAWQSAEGCASCHALSGWREISFDHDRTGFALEGAHRPLDCARCHAPDGDSPGGGLGSGPPVMTGASPACSSCHADPHDGQFSDRGPEPCAGCHGVDSWSPIDFDHDRDTRFPLVGGHREAACGACHPVEQRAGREVVRYRPLERSCASCHG